MNAPPPHTLVVPTSGQRPALLRRCLDSFVNACGFFEWKVELVVACNGTDTDEDAARNALRLAGYDPRATSVTGVRYCGRADRTRYVDRLVDELGGGADERATLTHALCTVGSDGANRNLLQLDAAGDVYVSADDDVVAFFSLPPGANLRGQDEAIGYDPTDFWFYPSREACYDQAPRFVVPPLASFELGRDVRVAQTGLVGDSGMSPSPYLLTHVSPATMARLFEAYPTARACRDVRRAVLRPTLCAGDYFMTYFCAFDGRELLPPFLPLARGADQVFASTLRSTVLSLVAHLPLCIVHDPELGRPPMLSRLDHDWARPSHLVSLALSAWPRPRSTDASWRMRSLAVWLRDLADDDDFEGRFRYLQLEHVAHLRDVFEVSVDQVAHARRPPEGWLEDTRRARASFQAALTANIPTEAARTWLRAYARLLAIWPDVDAAARRLRARGIRPALDETPF